MEIIEKYLHNKFIEWNVRFISLSDNSDTSNIGNKKTRQINGLVNEWYLEDVSNNIRSAFKAKMLNGEYISPFVVYGYKLDGANNNKLVIDDEASLTVKDIYYLYLKGYGYLGICKYLNDKNIPSPSYYKYLKGIKLNIVSNKPRNEIKWNTSAIRNILTNEIYIGNLIQGKRTTVSYKNHKIKSKHKKEWIKVNNTHTPIIEKGVFYRVQEMIKIRYKQSKNTNNVHVFSGLVFCSLCNGIMKKKNSNSHSYLVCSNSQINLCSNKKSIRYDKLESIILNELNNKLVKFFDKEILFSKINSNSNNYIKNIRKQISNNKNKINNIKFYIKELYEDKVNGIISDSQFMELIEQYEKEKCYYNRQIKLLNNKINNDIECINYSKYINLDKLDRIYVEEFIKSIYISEVINKNRNIKINWNF